MNLGKVCKESSMETSKLIATIFGVLYLSVGVGMYTSRAHYEKLLSDMGTPPWAIYFAGILALLAGILIVTFHNIWEASWVTLITLFGWMGAIKGVLLLAFPEKFMKLIGSSTWVLRYGWLVIGLGLIFCYLGLFT
jgi:hypothetical protein